jgi:hypothetical protein
VSAKVGMVKDPARNLRDRREGREVVIAVHADEV